jgi:hypothetical protein
LSELYGKTIQELKLVVDDEPTLEESLSVDDEPTLEESLSVDETSKEDILMLQTASQKVELPESNSLSPELRDGQRFLSLWRSRVVRQSLLLRTLLIVLLLVAVPVEASFSNVRVWKT